MLNMKPELPPLLALPLLLLGLAACSSPSQPPGSGDALTEPLTVPDAGIVVARVDDIEIRQSWLEALARGRGLDLADSKQRARALDELIEYAVLIGAARRHPELAAGEVRAEIELNALAGRANAILGRLGAVGEPDEASLRREYDEQSAINGDLEYKVAHLLFAEQALASEAGGRLAVAQNQEFSTIQAEYRDRAQQAVELGWIKLGQVPEAFAEALRGLRPGQTTIEPVQTPYGWHVIHLRETRPFQAPSFEQVREGIRRMLVARSTRELVDALKTESRIDIIP